MFCQKCGANFPDGNNFCPSCGTSVITANANQSQQQYQQPNQPNHQYGAVNQKPKVPGKGFGIASLVLGICAVLLYLSPFAGVASGVVGLVLGIVSINKAKRAGVKCGLAIAGVVCSIVGIVICAYVVMQAMLLVGAIGTILA